VCLEVVAAGYLRAATVRIVDGEVTEWQIAHGVEEGGRVLEERLVDSERGVVGGTAELGQAEQALHRPNAVLVQRPTGGKEGEVSVGGVADGEAMICVVHEEAENALLLRMQCL
jgi:hypothetical protein